MKKQLALGILISATAVSASAYQQHDLTGELLLGLSDQKTDYGEFGSASGDDVSFGIRGAYQFNPNVAFELAYQNYGDAEDTFVDEIGRIDETYSSSAWTAGVKLILPLEGGYSLIGRLGASRWKLELEELDSEFPGEVFIFDDRGTDLYYGVGVQLDVTRDLTLAVEYTVTDMNASLGDQPVDHEVRNLAVSLGFRF